MPNRKGIQSLCYAGVFALNRDVASFSAVVKSRDNKLLNLRSACRLTPGAEQIFHRCLSMHDLDEAWAPYKETKLSKLSQILEVPGMCQLASDILQRRQRSVHILPMGDCRYGFEEALLHVLSERIGREDVVVTEQALRTIRHDDVYLAVKLKTAKSLPEKYNQATCKYKQYHNALGLNLGSIRDHQVKLNLLTPGLT